MVAKVVATLFATILIPGAVAYGLRANELDLKRLEVNAAIRKNGIEHVKTVLGKDLDPDSRRRVYEYLVLAFDDEPKLQQWAKKGLKTSQGELDRMRKAIAEEQRKRREAQEAMERASERVRELADQLNNRASEGGKTIEALERDLELAKKQLSIQAENLRRTSVSTGDPANANLEGLRQFRAGNEDEAQRLFAKACKVCRQPPETAGI